jgi:tRNA 2-thiouridine synthesizing protein A
VVIDGGDLACVRLLLELRDRISHLPAGTLIHLTASDPAAPVCLPGAT